MNENLKKVVVTGSAGYLGSAMSYELLQLNYDVIGIDNYSNSSNINTKILKKSFKERFVFFELDIAKELKNLNKVFAIYQPDIVIHFAALKSVEESMISPNLYLDNNINGTKNLVESMKKNGCKNIIYSSSAAVYGNQEKLPINETANLNPISVYAESKLICEDIIREESSKKNLNSIILRYFNPIGYHKSGLFSYEIQNKTPTIINKIIKAAINKDTTLYLYGKDYNTIDGTCVRDFIDIEDLIDAHLKSLDYISITNGSIIFNIGTGKPLTILELTKKFMKYNNLKLNYSFKDKKIGDIESSYADVTKIKKTIGWESKISIKRMLINIWLQSN